MALLEKQKITSILKRSENLVGYLTLLRVSWILIFILLPLSMRTSVAIYALSKQIQILDDDLQT